MSPLISAFLHHTSPRERAQREFLRAWQSEPTPALVPVRVRSLDLAPAALYVLIAPSLVLGFLIGVCLGLLVGLLFAVAIWTRVLIELYHFAARWAQVRWRWARRRLRHIDALNIMTYCWWLAITSLGTVCITAGVAMAAGY